ncbi:hypothetical protein [Lutibacter agarilyticus]|nr:hypothetical protein [Lutibacter agarilyticus]
MKWYQENGRYFPWRKKSATNHGRFPKNRKEIEKLPTIGYYISNAIELLF